MLNDQEKKYLHAAIHTAIQHSPDTVAAGRILIPLLDKITNSIEVSNGNTSD